MTNLITHLVNLEDKGLVSHKKHPTKDLYIWKYKKKVFFDNLWNLDPLLLQCRGLVTDGVGNIVSRPFDKVFNLGENGVTVDPEKRVRVVLKKNGFMLSVTKYQGELLITTTGSFDSDFVQLGKKWVDNTNLNNVVHENHTYLFEVCDKSDPHIIDEDVGLYLLGIRNNYTGKYMNQAELYSMRDFFIDGVKSVDYSNTRFMYVESIVQTVKHEGFMIMDADNNYLCKIKSPYYLSKKFLQRMSDAKVDKMFANPLQFKEKLDEEFYEVFDYIITVVGYNEWSLRSEKQRSDLINEYFKHNSAFTGGV